MTETIDLSANVNTLWADIFISELVGAGLGAICFAPGSRSTPLVLAAAANPFVRLYRHLDERSAGFFALGLAKITQRPVALICTSGTAVANFHPAVIEAHQSHIPLIILSADRPPELRGSGANQTIDQLKLFGDHVGLFIELPVPQADASAVTIRHLRTAAARAFATSTGPAAGPVHVNFPFRKPLEPDFSARPWVQQSPTAAASTTQAPYSQFTLGTLLPTSGQVEWLVRTMAAEPKGVIICGPNCPKDSFPNEVVELSRATGYPVVADSLSGLRHGSHVSGATILGGYDLLLQAKPDAWPDAEVILRFGDVPTSAALNTYIERCAPDTYLHVRRDGVWADDLHLVRQFWQVDEAELCRAVSRQLRSEGYERASHNWEATFRDLEHGVWQAQASFQQAGPLYDGAVASVLLTELPNEAMLFAGNSLPIRHVDAYDQPSSQAITVFGNRGASGIDGNVSTAIGIAAGGRGPTVALVGDITFYHDMNGLLALTAPVSPTVTFIVLNNDGGGIFRRLPVACHEPAFSDLFLTPHGLTFEHAAAMYGLSYQRIEDGVGEQWRDTFCQTLARPGQQSTLIEVMTDGRRDLQLHRELLSRITAAVHSSKQSIQSASS